jgi:peptidoglycan/LPS O-acetylase OafA/YrhL
MTKQDRLVDIDVAKGIAIFLVVVGHVVARDFRPAGNEWFFDFRTALYYFHMSFFFYLTGYVFATARLEQYGQRVRRAAARMLPAYLLVAALAMVAKLALAGIVAVDRPIRSVGGDLIGMLLYPTSGFITFVWFIVALLGIYLLTLLAAWLSPRRVAPVLAVALVLHVASVSGWVTDLFALQQVARYWFIFVVGRLAYQHRERLLPIWRASWPGWLLLLVLSLMWLPRPLLPTVPALLCLPALHGLALFIAERLPRLQAKVAWLGDASWPIYLFNAFAIGGVKAIILATFGWDGPKFLLALPLIVAGGLLLPVLAQRLVLSRVGWLDRITR